MRSGGELRDRLAAGAVGVMTLGGSSASGGSRGSGMVMGGGAWRRALAVRES